MFIILGPRKRKVQKRLNFVGGFPWNEAYADKTSTEYLGIKATMNGTFMTTKELLFFNDF